MYLLHSLVDDSTMMGTTVVRLTNVEPMRPPSRHLLHTTGIGEENNLPPRFHARCSCWCQRLLVLLSWLHGMGETVCMLHTQGFKSPFHHTWAHPAMEVRHAGQLSSITKLSV